MPCRLRTLNVVAAIAALGAGAACPTNSTVVYCNSRSDCAATETCSDGICRWSGTEVDGSTALDHAGSADANGVDQHTSDAARSDGLISDAAVPDVAPLDTRLPDSSFDAHAFDRTTTDVAQTDATRPDSRQPDAAQPQPGICGDSAHPCRVVVDETVYQHDYLYAMPGLALDANATPHLLFSHNLSGFHGYYAVRTGANGWLVETLPMAVASGGLGIGAGGVPFAVTYGGNFVTSLWRRDSANWTLVEDVQGQMYGPSANGVEVDPSTDAVHAAIARSDWTVLYALHRDAWTTRDLTTGGTSFALALSPQREPQLAYIATGGVVGWQVYWAAPPAAPEVVLSLESSGINRSEMALVVPAWATSSNGGPHPRLLFAKPQSGQNTSNDLLLADRDESGRWATTTIAADTPSDDLRCGTPPTGPYEICDQDYDEVIPLALVADAHDNVRYLYAWQHIVATLSSSCAGPVCYWQRDTDNSTGQLRLGWLDSGGSPHDAVILDGVWIPTAAARVDDLDRIHLAVVDDGAPPTGTRGLRYLRLEP